MTNDQFNFAIHAGVFVFIVIAINIYAAFQGN
jgi:hypothetical protein